MNATSTNENAPPAQPVRLQKLLAEAGYGSRRACEEFITSGRVAVDGETVTRLGTQVDLDRQRVTVDTVPLELEKKQYFLVNKPPGYLCTSSDPRGRPRVIDLVPPHGRLYTVGRLDENSRGLLLVTNDGEMANKLLHPRYKVQRRYKVQVAGEPTGDTLKSLEAGLHFTEGKFRVRSAKKIRKSGKSAWLELVLTEGRNREIRRLLARVGHKVMKLERVGFGPLKIGRLKSGEYRPLTRKELDELRDLVRKNSGSSSGPPRRSRKKSASGGRPASKPGSSKRGGKPGASPKSRKKGGRPTKKKGQSSKRGRR